MTPRAEHALLQGTAFFGGLASLVIEIGGTRALAPYYGSSLSVWTAQITATLLFLALGYALGGSDGHKGNRALVYYFWTAGLWLGLYPFVRNRVLAVTAAHAGVALGAFFSAAIFFGVPLLCLGALGPLLIVRLDRLRPGAGSAAGKIFFFSTLGGIAGGWFTVLVLVPHLPLRISLAGTGLFLVFLGCLWGLGLGISKGAASVLFLASAALLAIIPKPSDTFKIAHTSCHMLMSHEGEAGLVQVMDVGPYARVLLINGVTQGGMSKQTFSSAYAFTESLNALAFRYYPRASSALLLGLGSGMLAKELTARSVQVSAIEIDPRVVEAARDWFGLPKSVFVINADARSWLNTAGQRYDLIFLDTYAGEAMPWYLLTREAMLSMKAALNPGGRVLVNLITRAQGSPGQDRVEAALVEVFGSELSFSGTPDPGDPNGLINATLVAGTDLKASVVPLPFAMDPRVAPEVFSMLDHGRSGQGRARVMVDDDCDLDDVDCGISIELRRLVFAQIDPSVLSD